MNYIKCLLVINIISVLFPLMESIITLYYDGSPATLKTINYSNKIKPFIGKFFWINFIDLLVNCVIIYDNECRMELNIGVRRIFNSFITCWNIISNFIRIYILYILYGIYVIEGEIIYEYTSKTLTIYRLLTIMSIFVGYYIYKKLPLCK